MSKNCDTIDYAAKKSILSQNKLLTYLWYLNLRYTLRGLGVIQKLNNDNNDEKMKIDVVKSKI